MDSAAADHKLKKGWSRYHLHFRCCFSNVATFL